MDDRKHEEFSRERLDRLTDLLIEELLERKQRRIPATDLARDIVKVLRKWKN